METIKKYPKAIQWIFLLIVFFACLTLNLPMSLGLNKVCLFKFEISTLSKSTMPILPTPEAAR